MKLKKSICVLDLETTGLEISKDQIIEIGISKITTDNKFEYKEWRIKPTIPIKEEAFKKHGISEDDLKECPKFKEVAREVLSYIYNCDLAGFNINRFDLPMLAEELLKNGFEITPEDYNVVDVMVIFHHFFRRNLETAYKYYTGKTLENAHTAEADTKATFEILNIQMANYKELGGTIESLSEFTWNSEYLDFEGKVKKNKNGIPCLTFGKYKDKSIQDIQISDPGYIDWFLKQESVSQYTKSIIQKARSLKDELDPSNYPEDLPFN